MLHRLFLSLARRPPLGYLHASSTALSAASRTWRTRNSMALHAQLNPLARRPWTLSAFFAPGARRGYSSRQYRAFTPANFGYWWRVYPPFRRAVYLLGGGTVCFVGYNMEQVPVTGRWRFNCVPEAYLEQSSEQAYRQTLREFGRAILPERAPEVQRVTRVLDRLIPHSGLSDGAGEGNSLPWTVHVIADQQPNAFVMPGRHVFVFSGILPIAGSDDGLAAVLGHEIAHQVAGHTAERMSRSSVLIAGALLLSLFLDVSGQSAAFILDLVYNRPGSRTEESEADHIGLLMMAAACYDPRQAIGLWERMAQAPTPKIPQFLSTHPSDGNRIKRIRDWMNEALARREASSCGSTGPWMDGFSALTGTVPFRD